MNEINFNSYFDAQKFCLSVYLNHVKNLDKSTIIKIMSIQSHGLKIDTDKDIIKTIDDNICFFPEVPNDIIVYRGGKMKIKNRPYLSGTFLYDVGFNYSNGNIKNMHKIIVKKGARIIPLYPFNKLYNFADPEMEIILDSSRLTKKLNYYIYK